MRRLVENPRFWRGFAGWMAIGHILLWGTAEAFQWVNDTTFISRLSLDALILACLAWWQGGRVEVRQSDDADVLEVLKEVRELRTRLEEGRK